MKYECQFNGCGHTQKGFNIKEARDGYGRYHEIMCEFNPERIKAAHLLALHQERILNKAKEETAKSQSLQTLSTASNNIGKMIRQAVKAQKKTAETLSQLMRLYVPSKKPDQVEVQNHKLDDQN